MSNRSTDWDDWRLFLALARGGSVAAAAARLRIDPTTVTRRLSRAEARLGASVFDRLPGRFVPTETGRQILAHAERIEAEIAAAEATCGAGETGAEGLVRLSTVPVLASRWLVPALPTLLAAHPGLRIEILAEPQSVSLIGREADIAIRLARPEHEAAVLARRIGSLAYGGFAAAGADLDRLPWLGYGEAMGRLPQARWIAAASDTPPPMLSNDAEPLLAAALAGLGKALLPLTVGHVVPGLIKIPTERPPVRPLWIALHPALAKLPRIRAVVDWIDGLAAALPGPPGRSGIYAASQSR